MIVRNSAFHGLAAEIENGVYQHLDIIGCVNGGIGGRCWCNFLFFLFVVAFVFTYLIQLRTYKNLRFLFSFVSGDFLVKGVSGKYFTAMWENKKKLYV